MMFPHFDKLIEAEFEQNCRLLAEADFPDPESAIRSLMRLREASLAVPHEKDTQDDTRLGWYRTLNRIFLEAPFPNAVVEAVDKFVVRSDPPTEAFVLFQETPRSLEVLARLACGSPFLTQTLLDQPEALRELTTERRTAAMKSREEFVAEAEAAISGCADPEQKLAALRCFQKREILRIGMCDAFGLLDLKFVTLQISLLADSMVRICLRIACTEHGSDRSPFCVIALGKHGGEELNYSSDIDLILIGRSDQQAAKIARGLIVGLSQKMKTGFLYRVDMRLRPWGDAGALVCSQETYEDYLANHAEAWEKQALLKARIVAGPELPGREFLQRLPQLLFAVTKTEVIDSVRSMKEKIESRLRRKGQLEIEVKLGSGSIRDIEFLVQALQLIHGRQSPQLASPNTLDALVRLAEFDVLDALVYRQLREGYIFLRTIEHALQLLHNQQTHELPAGEDQRQWLARRMDYPDANTLLARFNDHRRAIRRAFDDNFSPIESTQRSEALKVADETAGSGQSVLQTFFHRRSASESPTLVQRDLEIGSICRVEVCVADEDESQLVVSIAASQGAGVMSMICGVFFANYLDIREGDALHGPGRNRFGLRVRSGHFLGVFLCERAALNSSSEVVDLATVIERELKGLLLLQQEDRDSDLRAALLDMFCNRVVDLPRRGRPIDDPVVTVSESCNGAPNVMQIAADDTFDFLFEVSNAVSICGFRIRRAEIGQADGRICDTLHITEADGIPVSRPERIEELQTAVILIKQFTNWLPTTNDPHQALLRFRDLLHLLLQESQWQSRAETLRQPEVLRAVSRVLGISRYLWEDFLRVQTGKLLPLLTDPVQLRSRILRTDLELELQPLLESASTLDRAVAVLNEYKDHHLFRIDLRHVLGYCGVFGEFGIEITELAEIVVDAAARLAFDDLTARHGKPLMANGAECPFVIAALGKFGGIEMGFASDIEMFVVFQEDCQTDGQSKISGAVFFERLVQQLTETIQSRHKGIFEVDLRMRPYGQAGSPAISMETFGKYFAAGGEAWPYERQSLVKLRCVCGDSDFAKTLVTTCHSVIYGTSGFDFDAMRAMREQQIRQLVRGGTINAKLSDGGLVDCEYAVQALQMTFGVKHPELRTSNTLAAIDAACELGLLGERDHASAMSAYVFLRQLIDCLRMARGNAQDLTIPAQGSADYQLLEKRMQTVHDSPLKLEMLEEHLAAVRRFADRVEIACQG